MSGRKRAAVRLGSADFKARCLELIDRVKETRTEVIVTRHGRPVARLLPVDPAEPESLVGAMANSVLAFDAPFDPVPGAWSLDASDDER